MEERRIWGGEEVKGWFFDGLSLICRIGYIACSRKTHRTA